MLAEHKEEKTKSAAERLKLESENAKREINKALSAEQIHIKRRLSKKQQELREKLFVDVKDKLEVFMASPEYVNWIEEKIREAKKVAGENEVEIYLTPADEGFLLCNIMRIAFSWYPFSLSSLIFWNSCMFSRV